ncbi:MAG: glycoside hydrolase family 16 protein [Cyclobacteriaceae bacterium]
MNKCLIYLAIVLLLTGACTNTDNKKEVAQNDASEKRTDTGDENWEDTKLIWSDEFDGTDLSSDKWKMQTGASGWGNQEWQDYVKEGSVEVSEGTLKIYAKRKGKGQKVGDYTSARLNSKQSFTYGRMEIRAKIPAHKGNGLWPALWMLGENIKTVGWPQCGEIDLMEYVSYDPGIVHFTIHSKANNHVDNTQASSGPLKLDDIEEEFHSYGILWTDEYIKFYVDEIDNIKYVFEKPTPANADNWPFDKPFYFLMNIAVGGAWGGKEGVDDNIFPATMEIDYVRVYEKP